MSLSHIDETGAARMVDVSPKPGMKRTATARGRIRLASETLRLIREGGLKKGDALACARIAGIGGAKQTSQLIPLCHNIVLDRVSVDLELTEEGIEIGATARCTGKTGVEMEALTAVSIAALTIYDMCKAVDKGMVVEEIKLVKKHKEPTA